MKIRKYELATAIDKVKSIVQKNEQFPALSGALVKDGYLTASNMEMTVQVKLEAPVEEEFIIPMKAFDLIKNLPEGEINILSDRKNKSITVQTDRIKNTYQTYDPNDYMFYKSVASEDDGVTLPGKEIMEAFGNVLFAAADRNSNALMTGIYLEGQNGKLNIVGLDGHVIAWDQVDGQGEDGMQIVIPKSAVRKVVSMGMMDDITISFDKSSAILRSKEYVVQCRLIAGKYFPYARMFGSPGNYAEVDRKLLSEAVTRAKMCVDDTTAAICNIGGNDLELSVEYGTVSYKEHVELVSEVQEGIRIAFNAKLLLETVKAFSNDRITLGLIGPKAPMVVGADNNLKVAICPVVLR